MHDDILAIMANAALAADPNSFQIAREERLADDSASQYRPGGFALILGDGRTLADVTVANPFSAACVSASRIAGSPAAAAAAAFDRKTSDCQRLLNFYGPNQNDLTSCFVPLAVTLMGPEMSAHSSGFASFRTSVRLQLAIILPLLLHR